MKVGQKVRITCRGRGYCAGQTSPYPFWDEQFVPVEVIAENKNFYTVRTLPHTKPTGAWGPALPYTVSIDKQDVENKTMIVKEL